MASDICMYNHYTHIIRTLDLWAYVFISLDFMKNAYDVTSRTNVENKTTITKEKNHLVSDRGRRKRVAGR